MGLEPGRPIAGIKVDWVFIGSCTNSRLSDLREAARIVRGRKVADGVNAWVVPGSERVKRTPRPKARPDLHGGRLPMARARLQHVRRGQRRAGAARRARAVSTSNRNFIGRQGPARAPIWRAPPWRLRRRSQGCIADVRRMM